MVVYSLVSISANRNKLNKQIKSKTKIEINQVSNIETSTSSKVQISGLVMNINGCLVSGIVIVVIVDNVIYTTQTDEGGYFTLEIPTGEAAVMIEDEKYQKYEHNYTINADTTIHITLGQ